MLTYHIRPDNENMTPLIAGILVEARGKRDVTLDFEKGTYYFRREGSGEYDLFFSGGRSVRNHVVFPFQDIRGLTLRGNGAEFVFCDRLQPFMFQNCEQIRLENFSLDCSFLRYAYGAVTGAGEEGFAVQLDRALFDWFVDGNNLCFRCGGDVLTTKLRKLSCKRIAPCKSGIYFLYIGDTEAVPYSAAPNVRIDAQEQGEGLFFRYREGSPRVCFQPGDTVCIAYDNEREAQGIWMEHCRDIRMEGISLYRCGGMGVVADLCEDISVEGLNIRIKPGRKEYYPTTADGIFLTNCSGSFRLLDSCISGTYDDAMNIHGFYTFVEALLPDGRVRVGYRHDSHWGTVPCKVGDVLHVTDGESLEEVGTAKVTALEVSADRREMVLTLEASQPVEAGMLLENPDRMPRVLLENNVVENCPHMRLSARYMTVRNNRLNLNDNDIYINDLIGFWGESGAVEEVTICGNTFGNATGGNILVKSFRPDTSNRLHERIRIENNSFAKPEEKALRISGVRELTLKNNTFAGGTENDQDP